MSRRSYERQHLALFAAGSIDANGLTAIGFGCQLTRIAQGHYGVLLGGASDLVASSGLDEAETFTVVTVKGATPLYKTVNDDSATLKSVRVFDTSVPPTFSDADIEVAVYRTVSK